LDLDLVEVAPEANPPVCRIMDFGKFKFDAAQRAKESRRKTTSSSIKEMKYRPKIGTGDFDTKTRQVAKFLSEGHKVKITIMFRGREMSHPELGKKILDHVAEKVGAMAKVEAAPKLDGRNMIMVLAPDRRAQQASQGRRPAGDGAAPEGDAGPAVQNGANEPNGNTGSATAPPRPPTRPQSAAAPSRSAPAGAQSNGGVATSASPVAAATSADRPASPRPTAASGVATDRRPAPVSAGPDDKPS